MKESKDLRMWVKGKDREGYVNMHEDEEGQI